MKVLEFIEKYVVYLTIILLPVFILPYFVSPTVLPKEILLAVGVSLLLVLWLVKSVIKGSMSFASGKFDLAVLLIGLSYLLSAIMKTPNKMEAFFVPGTATFVLGAVLFYFLINQFGKSVKTGVAYSLVIAGVVLAVSILFGQTGVFAKIPGLPGFVRDGNFNALGGLLPSSILLATVLPIAVGFVIKHKDMATKLFMAVSGLIIGLGLIAGIANMLPGKTQALGLSDFSTSWGVTVDTLKVSPLWGIGPANYLTAFNRFRPLSYNQTDLWALRFTNARNYYLTAATELGFFGVLAFIVLFYLLYKSFRNFKSRMWEKASIAVLLLLFALFPVAPVLIVVLMVTLSLLSESEQKEESGKPARMPVVLAGLPVAAGIIALYFFGIKMVGAEYKFKLALEAMAKNDAKGAIENLQSSINLNSRVDRYHASMAQLNMALANAVSNKKEITDADRNTVSRLVQATINEGKAVVALNPARSGNWEILAQIYRSIMPFAKGADNFAVQTYTQAIALDPINPNLRIALGGTYFALGRLDEAIDTFKVATVAKPDFANAHYNLAIAYREKQDYKKATEEMNTVLSLVGKDSANYETALKELKNIESLQAPVEAEESNIKPPIELPQEATPPEAR